MKLVKFAVPLLAAAMLLPLMAAPSAAQNTPTDWTWSSPSAVVTDPWRFNANIYGWLPWAPAKIRTPAGEVKAPEDFSNILESLEMTLMTEFEVHKGPFGVFLSPIYYRGNYKDNFEGPLGRVDEAELSEKAWIVDYGLSYDLGTLRLGEEPDSPTVTVSPFAGFRYLHDKIRLSSTPGAFGIGFRLDETIEFNTPIVGLETLWHFTDRWEGRLQADFGGFSVDDVTRTYQVIGAAGYKFEMWGQTAKVYVGWRHLYIHYDDGPLAIKVKITGPFVGMGFEF